MRQTWALRRGQPFRQADWDAAKRDAVRELGLIGFHFHPIMQHFAVDDRRYYPLFELIDELKAAVMIDVGTTGMGAGLPGGMGAVIRHAHPASIDQLAADFPNLKIVMAHPGWPWVEETTAVALHKGNVYWEMSGWAPKYFPGNLKVDMRGRLQDKIMFGSDYPSMPYARILKEWQELGYSDAVMEKIFHQNAERIPASRVAHRGEARPWHVVPVVGLDRHEVNVLAFERRTYSKQLDPMAAAARHC